VIGLGKKSRNIYLLDFGMAKKYKDSKTNEHIPFRQKKQLLGSPLFASINSHKGFETSRRDDLESLVYMMIFF